MKNLTFKKQLLDRIHDRSTTVGVIGLGYVGLPFALLFEESDLQRLAECDAILVGVPTRI